MEGNAIFFLADIWHVPTRPMDVTWPSVPESAKIVEPMTVLKSLAVVRGLKVMGSFFRFMWWWYIQYVITVSDG